MGDFRMPSLGADMETGTILEWRVGPGDGVARGDIVAVVSTEKADIEIETFESGTIGELVALVGQEVPVGAVIATILPTDATTPEPPRGEPPRRPAGEPPTRPSVQPAPPSVQPAPPSVQPAPPSVQPTRRIAPALPGRAPLEAHERRSPVSPRARRRAAELGIDLEAVVAAAGGRAVTADDVERAAGPVTEVRVGSTAPPTRTPPPADSRGRSIDAVGRLMAQSKREIPHFYVTEEIDVSRALTWMEQRNEERPVGQRVLPAALLLRAVVLALVEVPDLNAHLSDGAIVVSDTVDLAVAVSRRGGGLVAPVIRGAGSLTLDGLMGALKGVVSRARSGALLSSDVDSATITVTNLGDQGAGAVWGVIVPPQVAIVGFGRIAERPWAVNGMLTVRRVVTVTLSADHRASHGHQGARFVRAIARALENPEALA